jgi:hypothetical protein
VSIATNCAAMNRELDYLVQDARQDYPTSAALRYELIRGDDGYRIVEDGREWRRARSPFGVLTDLYPRVYGKSNDALPRSTVFLHAASGSIGGRRFILMGESGVGKTTLMTRLAREDALLEGDELVALTTEGFVALPRRFHIKDPSLPLLPWIAAHPDRLPRYDNGDGSFIHAFAPSDWGYLWHIRNSPLDVVVLLESNHGGQSRFESLPRYRMVQRAMAEARAIDRRQHGWIGQLCRQFDRAACYRLVVGGLDNAAALLVSNLRQLPKVGA